MQRLKNAIQSPAAFVPLQVGKRRFSLQPFVPLLSAWLKKRSFRYYPTLNSPARINHIHPIKPCCRTTMRNGADLAGLAFAIEKRATEAVVLFIAQS